MSQDTPRFALSFVLAGMGKKDNPFTVNYVISVPHELFDGPVKEAHLWSETEIQKVGQVLKEHNFELVTEDHFDARQKLNEVADTVRKKVCKRKHQRTVRLRKKMTKSFFENMSLKTIDFSKPKKENE